jgi:2-methylisocitrate lyase-like PEP mutase family enzyme
MAARCDQAGFAHSENAAMNEASARFLAQHQGPCFVMTNPWDGGSAVLLKREGFAALATSSLPIAFAKGVPDGTAEGTREEALRNGTLIARLTGLPVNGDLEDGFGPTREDVVAPVQGAIAHGFAGLGIEDTTADPSRPIHDVEEAVAWMRAAAQAAKGRIVRTGRTDNVPQGRPDLDDTIRLLVAFAECGADVLYAPGLPDMASITAVVKAVAPKPVNVVFGPRSGPVTLEEWAAAGVKRVSLGGALYCHAKGAVVGAARELRAGRFGFMGSAVTTPEVVKPLRPG